MDELISRRAAIEAIDEWIKAFLENGHKESAADACLIQDGIIQLPSAQPEIIRCKDCKHWDGVDTCDVIDAPVWDNDFCSMAERRSDE